MTGDGGGGGVAGAAHEPQGGERAGAAEAGAAVDGDGPAGGVADGEEAGGDGGGRGGAVAEREVVVGDALAPKRGGVVRVRLVEPDDVRDAELAKNRRVVLRRKRGAVDAARGVGDAVERAFERNKLRAEDMYVAMCRTVQNIVCVYVEGAHVKPAELYGSR